MPKHYTLPQLSNDVHFTLTEDSKELFERGRVDQGYIGIVDCTNGDIHLLPAFNKGDGRPRSDKNNQAFNRCVESLLMLGQNTGDLHTRAVGLLKLGDKGGSNKKLLGFGLFKGSHGRIKEFRNRSASQNFFSTQYSSDFISFYTKFDDDNEDAAVLLKRSIPFEIFERIYQSINNTLNIKNFPPLIEANSIDNEIKILFSLEMFVANRERIQKDTLTSFKNLVENGQYDAAIDYVIQTPYLPYCSNLIDQTAMHIACLYGSAKFICRLIEIYHHQQIDIMQLNFESVNLLDTLIAADREKNILPIIEHTEKHYGISLIHYLLSPRNKGLTRLQICDDPVFNTVYNAMKIEDKLQLIIAYSQVAPILKHIMSSLSIENKFELLSHCIITDNSKEFKKIIQYCNPAILKYVSEKITLMEYACYFENKAVVAILLDYSKGDVDLLNESGSNYCPLMMACCLGNDAITSMLTTALNPSSIHQSFIDLASRECDEEETKYEDRTNCLLQSLRSESLTQLLNQVIDHPDEGEVYDHCLARLVEFITQTHPEILSNYTQHSNNAVMSSAKSCGDTIDVKLLAQDKFQHTYTSSQNIHTLFSPDPSQMDQAQSAENTLTATIENTMG